MKNLDYDSKLATTSDYIKRIVHVVFLAFLFLIFDVLFFQHIKIEFAFIIGAVVGYIWLKLFEWLWKESFFTVRGRITTIKPD